MANKPSKLDKDRISAVAAVVVVGAKAAHEVWEALNKDDRISNGMKEFVARLSAGAGAATPRAGC